MLVWPPPPQTPVRAPHPRRPKRRPQGCHRPAGNAGRPAAALAAALRRSGTLPGATQRQPRARGSVSGCLRCRCAAHAPQLLAALTLLPPQRRRSHGARSTVLSRGRQAGWQGGRRAADLPVRPLSSRQATKTRGNALRAAWRPHRSLPWPCVAPWAYAARLAARRPCPPLQRRCARGVAWPHRRFALSLCSHRTPLRSVWAENLPVVGSGIRDVRYIFLTRLRETARAPRRAQRVRELAPPDAARTAADAVFAAAPRAALPPLMTWQPVRCAGGGVHRAGGHHDFRTPGRRR